MCSRVPLRPTRVTMADDKDKEKVPVTEVLEEDDEFEVRA